MDNKFYTEALAYYRTVSNELDILLNYKDCTIERVFNYLKDQNKSTAKDVLTQMREDRLTRDDSFSDINNDSIEEALDTILSEYGLELNYNKSKDKDDCTQDNFRFLITYGGPHAEVKFYSFNCIEFIYRNGNDERIFTTTLKPEYIALRDYFESSDSLNFEESRALAVEGDL